MAGTDLVLLLLKHSLTVALVLLVLRHWRGASAARRVFVARCGLLALLLALLLTMWLPLPALPLHLPYAVTAMLDAPLVLPDLPWLARPPVAAAGFGASAHAAILGRGLLLVWGTVAGLMIMHMLAAVLRLQRLASVAALVTAPAWCASLARLRARDGVKRQVTLLVSDRVRSPLSWGLRRCVIVIDPVSLRTASPDAVLAHELAHIARHDWPVMLFARALVALYWWHPLMHLLQRTLAHDIECAADDAVLASGILASEYAQTLVSVSRHAFAPGAATGLAGRGAALVARIGGLLEARRARGPVSAGQWLAGSGLTLALVLVLGSLVVRGEHVVWPERLLGAPADDPRQDAARMLEGLDNPNFRQLAQAMRSGDVGQRHAPGGTSFRQRAAIPALMLALQDRRPAVRQLALWALGEMSFPETAPAIAALLTDPAPAVRAEAAAALGDLGEVRWLPVMLALLRDGDPVVRARVAHALGDLADPAAILALRAARTDPDPDVAAQVDWALAQMR